MMKVLKVLNTILMAVIAVSLIAILVVLLTKDGVIPAKETETSNVTGALTFKTPYCELEYPEKWEGLVKYAEKEENGVYTGTFYCLMKEQEIPMFDIYFGAPETGTMIGYILKDSKSVPFSVKTSDYQPDSSWTEDEQMIYYGMANAINTVIESVTNDPNYLG